MGYFDIICDSPSHIYYSALPLSPSSSWVKKCSSVELTQSVKVIKGCEAGWGACSRTVLLGNFPSSLSCSYRSGVIALGLDSGGIMVLDATTGNQVAVLSGHTGLVKSVAFSPDGILLVSGGNDRTARLWDMQTGEVIKTFCHDTQVLSVSVSVDCTIVASGTEGGVVHLWDIKRAESKCVIMHQNAVEHINFAPTDPLHFISISGDQVQQWDLNGHKVGQDYCGSYISLSPDYTLFVLCNRGVITVQNLDSGALLAKFHVSGATAHCSFSPDCKLVAAVAGYVIYVWDIVSSEPYLVETFAGHCKDITSLKFLSPSALVSTSWDKSVRFWQIEALPADPVMTNPTTSSTSTSIKSVTLQVKDGLAISSDLSGLVKTWDILTGLCKASFQTPASNYSYSDAQLMDDKLIFCWSDDKGIQFWDSHRDGPEKQVLSILQCSGLRISEDGSSVFCLTGSAIQVWSMWTWECMGEVDHGVANPYLDPLHTDNLKIWIGSEFSFYGWDFGVLSSSPVPVSNVSVERPHLELVYTNQWECNSITRIKDRQTGKEVFQFSGRYAAPKSIQWDGQCLVAGYESGEVFILDFHYLNVR